MKKLLISILVLILAFSCSGCFNNVYYKDLTGYKEYISDNKSGYEDVPYFYTENNLYNNKKAREYYKNNIRRSGNFLITDYEDGICINRYYGDSHSTAYDTITIPETIEGKPVVKLGGYVDGFDVLDMDNEVVGAFGGNVNITLEIPATVKYISANSIEKSIGIILERERYIFVDIFQFVVDDGNPYYASKNGALYTKDFKKLLWVNTEGAYEGNPDWNGNGYIVPDFVEVFEPANCVHDLLESITIGKNVKKINTGIDKGEDGTEPNKYCIPDVKIRGYKNTAAEKWAKDNYAKFVPLDTK